ncbi:MAG: hypothetical protein KF724_08230 [Phycisphaeraceae bacterium]|nr:hypothetical protein [Phycisphaeraceae bacterium]
MWIPGGRRERLARSLVLIATCSGALAASWSLQTLLRLEVLGPSSVTPGPFGLIAPVGAVLRTGLVITLIPLNIVAACIWWRIGSRPPLRRRAAKGSLLIVAMLVWGFCTLLLITLLVGGTVESLDRQMQTIPESLVLAATLAAQFAIYPWPMALAARGLRADRDIPFWRRVTAPCGVAGHALLIICAWCFVSDAILLFEMERVFGAILIPPWLHWLILKTSTLLWNGGVPLALAFVAGASLVSLAQSAQAFGIMPLLRRTSRTRTIVAAMLVTISLLSIVWFGCLVTCIRFAGFTATGEPQADRARAFIESLLADPFSLAQLVLLPLVIPAAWIACSWWARRLAYSPMSSAQRSGFSR